MNVTIKEATVKSDLFLSYKFDQRNQGTRKNTTESSDAAIHDDLRKAFNDLIPHFAFICEEIDEKKAREQIQNPDQELEEFDVMNNYKVHGFNLGKHQEGVTIAGTKKLKSGDTISFSTPFKKWDDSEYEFMDELTEAMDVFKSEVYEYLEGKQAISLQIKAEFPEAEESAI